MRSLLSLFLCLLILLPHPVLSQKQPLCDEGITRCQRLFEKPAFYTKCMALMCDEQRQAAKGFRSMGTQEENLAKKAQAQAEERQSYSCDNGFRRCSKLRTRQNIYWECVKDTCTDPTLKDADPSCEKGREICKPRLVELSDCMRLTCRNPNPTMDNCPRAREVCAAPLNDYWDCMSNICIGNINRYRQKLGGGGISRAEEDLRKQEGDKLRFDDNGKPIFPQRGVHPSMQYPPEGVSADQWRVRIPPERYMIGNPANTMVCPAAVVGQPTVRLRCQTRDYLSCQCSDGTRPMFKPYFEPKQYEKFEYKQEDVDRTQSMYQGLIPYVPPDATEAQKEEAVLRAFEMIETISRQSGTPASKLLYGKLLGQYDKYYQKLLDSGRIQPLPE